MSTEQIWELFHKQLFYYIKSRVRNEYDAQDIHANVFLKILNNKESLNIINNVHAWVYRIARNSIIDYYRSNIWSKALPTEFADDEIDILGDLTNEQLRVCLLEIIKKLPKDYREALVATQINELSAKDFAQLSGYSLAKVKSLVRRGKIKLKTIADECLNDPASQLNCCVSCK